VNSHAEIAAEQLVIAPLRWERFDVRVEEDEGPDDVGDRLLAEIVRFGREIQDQGSTPRVLGLRPRLVGVTRHHQALRRAIKQGVWNGSIRSAGATLVFIDKVLDDLELAHDLITLASGDDPPALMARKLLILQSPSEERSALLEATREALQDLANEPRWSVLDEERDNQNPLSDDQALADLLSKSAMAALNDLLSQRVRAEFAPGVGS